MNIIRIGKRKTESIMQNDTITVDGIYEYAMHLRDNPSQLSNILKYGVFSNIEKYHSGIIIDYPTPFLLLRLFIGYDRYKITFESEQYGLVQNIIDAGDATDHFPNFTEQLNNNLEENIKTWVNVTGKILTKNRSEIETTGSDFLVRIYENIQI